VRYIDLKEASPTSTTIIRLPKDLKARVAAAAERAGTTPHSVILEAIAEKAEEEEHRHEFQQAAEQRYAGIVANGKAMAWEDVRQDLVQRVAGKP